MMGHPASTLLQLSLYFPKVVTTPRRRGVNVWSLREHDAIHNLVPSNSYTASGGLMQENDSSCRFKFSAFVLICLLAFVPLLKAQQLVNTISTGNYTYPYSAAVDTTRSLLYVVLNGVNAVQVVDLKTSGVLRTVSVGANPKPIAIDPSSGMVYVGNASDNTVTIINPSSNFTKTTVAGGTTPFAIAVNPVNNKVYVVDYSTRSTVTVIDPSHNYAVSTISTSSAGLNPFAIAINHISGKVYVTSVGAIGCGCAGAISIIDPNTNAQTSVAVGKLPQALAIDATSGNVYVVNGGSNNVEVLDANGNYQTAVTVGSNPAGIVLDWSGIVYVANSSSNTVSVINPTSSYSVTTIPVGAKPETMAFDPSANLIEVAETGSSSEAVSFIQPGSSAVLSRVPLGAVPYGLVVNAPLQQTYAVNTYSFTISVITD